MGGGGLHAKERGQARAKDWPTGCFLFVVMAFQLHSRFPSWASVVFAMSALSVLVMVTRIEAGQHTSAFLTTPSLRLAANHRSSIQVGVPRTVMTATPIDKHQERRRIISSENFNRRGFKEAEEEVQGMMAEEFTSDLVKQLRENNYILERNNVVVKLAKSYGFCWGVDRAVALAYEARKFYKDDKIHITNEIIHNPSVNTTSSASRTVRGTSPTSRRVTS